MMFKQISVGPMDNFAYLIGDELTGEAIVVDCAWDIDKILKIAAREKLRIQYIINTHSHFDHTQGNLTMVKYTGAKVVAHVDSTIHKDISVKDGDILRVGGLKTSVLHTPGHSPDGICLLVGNKLLTGDTLFVGECGRTDLPGSSPEAMYHSLFEKLMKLPDDVEIYPGHNYGRKLSSTIGYEKNNNYVLKPRSLKEFILFMKEP